ncbi:MAG: polysaccharide deacetylase family protein, partial [Oscillatoria sp. SIO1A7]|nr:polysaccharide deacetylase family protein [Oscillatoria sp. SIO1A7]
MFHALSIDVEDWYQGLELPIGNWNRYQKRVHIGMGKIMEILEESNYRATFFILGKVAEENRGLVKKIQKAGHEIGTHGYSHQNLSQMNPKSFRSELRHSIALLEDLTGEKVIGHRAAYFSITKKTLWALDILAEEGILYDSSIYPVINWRYGIPNANRLPSYINLKKGLKILEIPISTLQLTGFNFPIG